MSGERRGEEGEGGGASLTQFTFTGHSSAVVPSGGVANHMKDAAAATNN